MIRRLEARIGRTALLIGGFLVATLVVCAPVGILGSSNLLWGEANQYGRVDVPGTKVLHLPGGTVDVAAAIYIPGKGNETVDLPLPSNLSLAVSSVGGSAKPTVTRDVGDSGNASDDRVNTQRQVFSVDVPQDGDYRVTARGDFRSLGVNPQLWFGHGPPLPGVLVPVVAAGLVLLGGLVWFVILRVRGRRRGTPSPAAAAAAKPTHPIGDGPDAELAELERLDRSPTREPSDREGGPSDPTERLERLADLRDRGVLSNAEFATEKAKILAE